MQTDKKINIEDMKNIINDFNYDPKEMDYSIHYEIHFLFKKFFDEKKISYSDLFSISMTYLSPFFLALSIRNNDLPYVIKNSTKYHPIYYINEYWNKNKNLGIAIISRHKKFNKNDYLSFTILSNGDEQESEGKIGEYIKEKKITISNNNLILSSYYLDYVQDHSNKEILISEKNIEIIINLYCDKLMQKVKLLSDADIKKIYTALQKMSLLRYSFHSYNLESYKIFSKFEIPNYLLVTEMIKWLVKNQDRSIDPNNIIENEVLEMLKYSFNLRDFQIDKHQYNQIKKLKKSEELLSLIGWKNSCKYENIKFSPETVKNISKLGIETDNTKKTICSNLEEKAKNIGDKDQFIGKQVSDEKEKFKAKFPDSECQNDHSFENGTSFYFKDSSEKVWCLDEEQMNEALLKRKNPLNDEELDPKIIEELKSNIETSYKYDDIYNFLEMGYILKDRKKEELIKIEKIYAFKGNELNKSKLEDLLSKSDLLIKIGYKRETVEEMLQGLSSEHKKFISLLLLNKYLDKFKDYDKKYDVLKSILDKK